MKSIQSNKKYQKGSMPWQILIVVAVALVVPITVFLVRQNQDIRQRATPTVNCVPGEDANSLTRWGWKCTGSNVANRTSEYSAWQCPQNNVPSCTTHFGGVQIPLTCANIEGNGASSLNCSPSNGFLNVKLPQSRTFINNPLPLGQCGCVQTDFVVDENGTPAVAGGVIRCFEQACNMTQPPVCQVVSVEKTQIPIGDSSSIAFSASDPDNNLNKIEMWYGPVPSPNGQWTHMSPNKTTTPYEMTRDFTCTPEMAGKSYYVTCNAYDAAGNACSGNPINDAPWWFRDCGPNDYVTVTCTNSPKPTTSPSPSPLACGQSCGPGLPACAAGLWCDRYCVNKSCTKSPNCICSSPSPTPSLEPCAGVTISCSGICTAINQFTYTCNWTKPEGAVDFTMAYKDTTASNSAWRYENSNVTTNQNWKNDKTRWIKSFTNNVSRDFMLRVYTSSTCTPGQGAYGNRATVTDLECINPSSSPTPTPPPGPRCQEIRVYKLNGPVNELSSWGEPLTAEDLAAMSSEGTIGPDTQLYFTVTGNNAGNTPLINYQKGRIKVNSGTNQGGFLETTNTKPSDGNLRRVEYYVLYTVPQYSTRTTFSIEGEVCAVQGDSCTWY